jgi:hypothetical protein
MLNIKAVEPSNAPSIGTDYMNDYKPASVDGAFFVFGLDPKMALNYHALDGVFRFGYTLKHNEVYIGSEVFEAIDFYSYNLGYDRMLFDRKLSLLVGGEYALIQRPRGLYHSVGLNTTSRYKVKDWLYLELRNNLKSRPDITKPYIFSNYITLYFKF